MMRVLLMLLWLGAHGVAAAEHDAWMQGRPGESLPELLRSAQRSNAWSAWFDAGLCAAAAGERGQAVAYLWNARRAAPLREEPKLAFAALGVQAPVLWSDRLAWLAWSGQGWPGVVLLGLGGVLLGWWICAGQQRRRWRYAALGLTLSVVAAPGAICALRDAANPHRAVWRDSQLLDSTGAPLAGLPAGMFVEVIGPGWSERLPIRLDDGRVGLVAASDLR